MEMGYLTVLYVRLGAKIGDLHAKDSHSFRNGQNAGDASARLQMPATESRGSLRQLSEPPKQLPNNSSPETLCRWNLEQ